MMKRKRTIIILVIILIFLKSSSYASEYGPFKPDAEGFIRDWLICGPFPNEPAEPVCKGFDIDFLKEEGGEENIEPFIKLRHRAVFVGSQAKEVLIEKAPGAIGEIIKGWQIEGEKELWNEWKPFHWNSSNLDLYELNFTFKEYIISYAACYIESPREMKVKLKIGSDDGYKIWLNSEYIGGLHAHRAAEKDQNVYEIELKKGINILLVKITQYWYGYNFFLRFTDIEDKPVNDINIFLVKPGDEALYLCSGLDTVNAVDKDLVGYIKISKESRFSLFPGSNNIEVNLCSAREGRAKIEVSILDRSEKIITKERVEEKLSNDKSTELNYTFFIPQPGKYSVRIKVLVGKENLGVINRGFYVLDPDQIYQDLLTSKVGYQTLLDTIRRLESNIANLNYIIHSKEGMIEENNKEISVLYEEINRLGEKMEGKE